MLNTRPYSVVGHTVSQALTDFVMEFDSTFAAAPPESQWATRFAVLDSSTALKTTFSIPVSAAGYVERKGNDRMRRLYAKATSVTSKDWVDGVQVKADIIRDVDFIGWGEEPSRIAVEASRHPNTLAAGLLHDNPYLDWYRDERPGGSTASTIRLFSASHLVNVFDPSAGVQSNISTASAINAAFVTATKLRFARKVAPNGQHLGARFTHLLVPSALEQQALDFFESDTLISAVTNVGGSENVGGVTQNNRHKGTVEVVVCPELLDDNIVYPLWSGTPTAQKPFVIRTPGMPETITYDESDALYKDTGEVGVKFVMKMGIGGFLPMGIEQVTIG